MSHKRERSAAVATKRMRNNVKKLRERAEQYDAKIIGSISVPTEFTARDICIVHINSLHQLIKAGINTTTSSVLFRDGYACHFSVTDEGSNWKEWVACIKALRDVEYSMDEDTCDRERRLAFIQRRREIYTNNIKKKTLETWNLSFPAVRAEWIERGNETIFKVSMP